MIDVEGIVKEYVEKNGYDGLWNEDGECGCEISNLVPCGEICSNCKPGFKKYCKDCDNDECNLRADGCEWCMMRSKS